MNISISIPGGGLIHPWGSTVPKLADPIYLSNLSGNMWGFTDADQEHVLVKGKPGLPTHPGGQCTNPGAMPGF